MLRSNYQDTNTIASHLCNWIGFFLEMLSWQRGSVSRMTWEITGHVVACMSPFWHSADKICICAWFSYLISNSFKKTIHERRNDFKIWLPLHHSTSPGRWSDSLKFHFSEILRILRVKSSFEHLLKITYQNEYAQNLCVFFSVFQGVDETLKICWQISKFDSSFYPHIS